MKIKSFDRRNELMEAAIDEFSSKSYEEASLNNIIKNAGISKGTFYYHFQDKQALYLSLMQSLVDAKLEFLERKLKNYSRNDDLNIFDQFRLQARFGVEFAKEYPMYYLLGLMFYRERGNEIYNVVMNAMGDISDNFYDNMVDIAVKKGELRAGISIPFVKKILPHMFYRCNEIFRIKLDEVDFDLIVNDFDELIDFIQYGLGNDKPNK